MFKMTTLCQEWTWMSFYLALYIISYNNNNEVKTDLKFRQYHYMIKSHGDRWLQQKAILTTRQRPN